MNLKKAIKVQTICWLMIVFCSGCGSFMGRVEHIGLTGHGTSSWGAYPGVRFDVSVITDKEERSQHFGILLFFSADVIPSSLFDTLLLPLDIWQMY